MIAPWREWTLKSREDCLDYAEAHGIQVEASRQKIHSRDRNLWHISHEGGELEDAGNAPLASTWTMTRSPQEAPDREETVEIGFAAGTPVSVDGMRLTPVQIVELLNEIGARNAIGRIDLVENRFVGIKSRGIYETPGGTLITAAHRELEALTLDREVKHYKQHISLKYAEIVYYGLWFTPLREALDGFVETTQKNVTGTVKLALYKGNVRSSRTAVSYSLYSNDLSSFTMGESYDQKDANGFIRILGLPARTRARLLQKERDCSVKMWSGRFREPLDPEFEAWQRSFPFDWRLLPQEMAASKAHAQTIAAAGIFSAGELIQVLGTLDAIGDDHAATPPDGDGIRDLGPRGSGGHSPLCRAGDDGAHRRSGPEAAHRPQPQRADCHRSAALRARAELRPHRLVTAFLVRGAACQANHAGDAAMPAYTHMQRAEPVLVAHWLLAYVEMLHRDITRLEDLRRAHELLPAGVGSRSRRDPQARPHHRGPGTGLRRADGEQHGRDQRPRLCPGVFCKRSPLSRCMPAVSRKRSRSTQRPSSALSQLPERFSTGSSAMPQKKNPDLTELVRAKVGRIHGAAQTVAMVLKGLPLAYNKDMQETQQPVFAAAGAAEKMIRLLGRFTSALNFNFERMRTACEQGYLNAMAAATYLVHKGVPFRTAHEKIGQAVRYGMERGLELNGLSLAELKQFAPEFDQDFYASITLEATVNCHDVIGGTAAVRVAEALRAQKERLSVAMGQINGNS